LRWINAEDLETEGAERYLEVNGLLGEVSATAVWMEDLGSSICPRSPDTVLGLPGMQCLEWARHLAELEDANSAEFAPNGKHPVINLARTARCCRFGRDDAPRAVCAAYPNTLAFKLYQEEVVYERHRHRYEFNNAYRNLF